MFELAAQNCKCNDVVYHILMRENGSFRVNFCSKIFLLLISVATELKDKQIEKYFDDNGQK